VDERQYKATMRSNPTALAEFPPRRFGLSSLDARGFTSSKASRGAAWSTDELSHAIYDTEQYILRYTANNYIGVV
jgi:hypothetical protein